MNHSEQIERAKEALKWRLELLREVTPKIRSVAESGGKDGVERYLLERFDAKPVERGTDLLFNGWIFRFDESGAFLGISSDAGPQRSAVLRSDTMTGDNSDT